MWLNPQSWAVISGLATKQQAELSMENVRKRLNTEYGAILMDPPYHLHAFDGALAVIYNPGTKENAGIFSQSQGWLILAEALLGHGDQAFTYFMENAPSAQNDLLRSGNWSHTVMDSLRKEKTARILVVPMCTG